MVSDDFEWLSHVSSRRSGGAAGILSRHIGNLDLSVYFNGTIQQPCTSGFGKTTKALSDVRAFLGWRYSTCQQESHSLLSIDQETPLPVMLDEFGPFHRLEFELFASEKKAKVALCFDLFF